ncbi:MAG: hypothetical protein AB7U97_06275 [Pirellulales bacterium]
MSQSGANGLAPAATIGTSELGTKVGPQGSTATVTIEGEPPTWSSLPAESEAST